jgi:hypothetical protein
LQQTKCALDNWRLHNVGLGSMIKLLAFLFELEAD